MPSYSFLDVTASLVGPGGNINLGAGSNSADEGISVSFKDAKNQQSVGADGSVMNSLHASKAATITVRLQKTSPVNQRLSKMFNIQQESSAVWGLNAISIRNKASGDSVVATDVAFQKHPDINYAKDGDMIPWVFDARVNISLGGGVAAALASLTATNL